MALQTIVYHVCEKTDGSTHIPDVGAVYEQIVTANAGKFPNVLLLPEHNGHAVWADELTWIENNFVDIPVMLDVAGGWEHKLTTDEITAAMAVADVQWLRFSELTSWFIEHEEEFPDDYVLGIFAFCRANNIKLFWTEWKIDFENVKTFSKIAELVAGYEDIVTVAFKTNSGDLEPATGFKYVFAKGFTHIGATIESWYWETRHRSDVWEPISGLGAPDNMPVSWMVCHAQEAVSAGVELIQFEPYWYFFDKTTGKAKDSLGLMHRYLNSSMSTMPCASVILQTLQAEWLNSQAPKDKVAWLGGRASTVAGWDIQPSSFDFKNMPKQTAVTCYSVGSSSPSGKAWLKYETVAVDVIVKVLGSTLDKAALIRESMKVEVERILALYSKVAPLWDPNPGPTGVYKRRKIPGLDDVVISQEGNLTDDSNASRFTVQVKCRVFPKNSWVSV